MMFMIGGTLLAIIVGLIIGSARRDRKQADAVRAVQDRLSTRYNPEQLFISTYDYSAIGLSPERGVVVLGTAETDIEAPFTTLVEVEGIRDGVLLRRFRRGAPTDLIAQTGSKADVVRVNTLDLRITLADPDHRVWTVRFFDWPAGGVSPGNVAFQAAARDAERWFALLQQAMAADASAT